AELALEVADGVTEHADHAGIAGLVAGGDIAQLLEALDQVAALAVVFQALDHLIEGALEFGAVDLLLARRGRQRVAERGLGQTAGEEQAERAEPGDETGGR